VPGDDEDGGEEGGEESEASTVDEDAPDNANELEAESREQLYRDEDFNSSHLSEGYDAVVDMTTIFGQKWRSAYNAGS
jgi:hypothetical protein